MGYNYKKLQARTYMNAHAHRHQGGGGVLLFVYTYVEARAIFGGPNFEFQYLGGGSEKWIFLGGGGYGDFVDILGGHHKIGLYLGVIYMHFSVFS